MPSVPMMTPSENRLDHEGILELRRAVISACLGESRRALLAHISAELVASLPVAAAPGEQVLMDIDALDRIGELTDGSVPLAVWLRNAIQLCGGRQEEKIFSDALEQVRGGAALSARSQGIKSARQEPDQPAATIVHHHHGDAHMGSTFTTNITGSTIGAFAQGDGAVATGHVVVGAAGTRTQEQHKTAISQAQTALVHDQDALERIDDRLYEALGQFLTLARKIQVEQQSLAEVQAKMKETLDDVWAQQEAKGMKLKLLPEGLGVVEALAKSPITAEIARRLLGA